MGRPAQIFDAPGPPDEPLAAESSPWREGHYVRIPLEYWMLVLEFARRIDADAADRLEGLSGTAFVREIAVERDEYPDAFPNAEIARMGRDVLAVLDESLRRGEPFRAWDE